MKNVKESNIPSEEKEKIKHAENNRYEYVMAVRSTLDNKSFPNEFDTWTVNQQYDWINKNLQELYPNVPRSLLHLIPGFYRQDDCCPSQAEIPAWLDIEKYRKGQRFVQDNFVSISAVTILSLLHTYSFSDELKPIILGGQSHTPYLAWKRYASTGRRIQSWYEGEPWVKGTPAYNEMLYTRKIHNIIRAKISKLNYDEYDALCTFANPWCPDREHLLKDFAACPPEKPGQFPFKVFTNSSYRPKPINHADIAAVQYAFMGTLVLQPHKFGAHDATDEELECFCHMWRCYGYLLGMDDEYNLCRGSLEEIKQGIQDLNDYWVIPHLKYVTPEWEHVTRCLVESLNFLTKFSILPYKCALLLDMDILGVNMRHLYASLSYSEWATYHVWKFILHYLLKSSHIRTSFSKFASNQKYKSINFSSEKEMKLQEKSKKYMGDFAFDSIN